MKLLIPRHFFSRNFTSPFPTPLFCSNYFLPCRSSPITVFLPETKVIRILVVSSQMLSGKAAEVRILLLLYFRSSNSCFLMFIAFCKYHLSACISFYFTSQQFYSSFSSCPWISKEKITVLRPSNTASLVMGCQFCNISFLV